MSFAYAQKNKTTWYDAPAIPKELLMTKELKFDRARFDAGEMPTRTRDGTKVLWCAAIRHSGPIYGPIAAILEDFSDVIRRFDNDGYCRDGDRRRDLVHEPRTTKVPVGIRRLLGSAQGEYVVTTNLDTIGDWSRGGLLIGVHTFEVEE